jgi:hypothetical protein
MDLYSLLVFAHVLGGVGLFAAIGIEAVALRRLQRAEIVEQAHLATSLLTEAGRLGPVAMVTIVAAGVWMMAVRWGPEPWILTALVALIAMVIVGAALTRRAMPRLIGSLGNRPGEVPAEVRALADGPLQLSLRLRLAIAVGILGLMTVKPGTILSVTIIGAAVVAGLAWGIRALRRGARTTAPPARSLST